MTAWGPLHGGATADDGHDDDGHTAAVRNWDRQIADHQAGRHRLHDRHGIRADPHPGDRLPEQPTRDGNRSPYTAEEDPTGRRHHQSDHTGMVLLTVHCTAPGCTVHGTYYGTDRTLERIRTEGGPRCQDHPLNPTRASQAAAQAESGA